ncbi:hypothetical protein QR680_016376 [Steinernema hermaphroditum]|uniref:Protein kinase domain-containing protein n=1 Tax=Steinernema hermaphroditum TaxID=289476 RepID=A0AA39HB16_9BILA|nr:hypothetical protein QR680_016376 [Steinernema hermaphroditum]
MTLPTPSKKTGRQTTQNNPGNVDEKRSGSRELRNKYCKPKIKKLPKQTLDQMRSAPGYSNESFSESKAGKKGGGTSAANPGKQEQQEHSKRKLSSKPMPSLRLGFAIKCKKDDVNQRYDLVVESQLANRIYIVRNTKNDRMCCMKIEPFDSSNELKQLKRDVFVMLDAIKYPIFGMKHFLPIVNKGVCHEYFNYVVMPLCEGSLADIRENVVGGDFSPETALRLTFDTFQAINDLHGLGHIHRAISPHKFVVGIGGKGLYLVGLSLCIRANNPSQTSPRKLEHYGNNRYQCRNWHRNKKQYWRDDFESWLFMVIDFFGMKLLPWNGDMSDMEVLVQKERLFNNAYDDIFSSAPKQFEMLLRVLNKMDPHEKPDYQFIAYTLVTLREKIKCELKGPYDFSRKDVTQSARKKKGAAPKKRSAVEEDERELRRKPARSAPREDDEAAKPGKKQPPQEEEEAVKPIKKPAAQEEEETTKPAKNRSPLEEEEEAAKPKRVKNNKRAVNEIEDRDDYESLLPIPDQLLKMSNNKTKKKELHVDEEADEERAILNEQQSKLPKTKIKKLPFSVDQNQILNEVEDEEQLARPLAKKKRSVVEEAEESPPHLVKKETAAKLVVPVQEEVEDTPAQSIKKKTAAKSVVPVQEEAEETPPQPVRKQTAAKPIATLQEEAEEPPAQPVKKKTAPKSVVPIQEEVEEPPAQPVKKKTAAKSVVPVQEEAEETPAQPLRKQTAAKPIATLQEEAEEPPAQPVKKKTAPKSVVPIQEEVEEPPAQPVKKKTAAKSVVPVQDEADEPPAQPVKKKTAAKSVVPVQDEADEPAAQPVKKKTAAKSVVPVQDEADEPAAQPVKKKTATQSVVPVQEEAEEPPAQPVKKKTAAKTNSVVQKEDEDEEDEEKEVPTNVKQSKVKKQDQPEERDQIPAGQEEAKPKMKVPEPVEQEDSSVKQKKVSSKPMECFDKEPAKNVKEKENQQTDVPPTGNSGASENQNRKDEPPSPPVSEYARPPAK